MRLLEDREDLELRDKYYPKTTEEKLRESVLEVQRSSQPTGVLGPDLPNIKLTKLPSGENLLIRDEDL